MFTVVDLFPSSAASATGINKDGWVCGWAAGLIAFVFVPNQTNAATGTTVQLAPPLGGISAQGLGINNRVDVVGWAGVTLPQGGFQQAAFWRSCGLGGATPIRLGTLVALPPVFLGAAQANGINDSRLIVGWSELSVGGIHRAVLWDGNAPINPPVALDALDPTLASEAMGINDNETIVGFAQDRDVSGNVVNHAVTWNASTLKVTQNVGTFASIIPTIMTDLHAEAMAINDAGAIVGVGDHTNGLIRLRSGFIVPVGGSMDLIPMIPSPTAGAWHVSPNATVALTITVPAASGPVDHGATFSMQQGLFDVDTTTGGASGGGHGLSGGWLLTDARGVNDHGEICGRGSSVSKPNHGLLLVP